MKSPKALIWSCCISVMPLSSSSSPPPWGVLYLSSAPLLLCVWLFPLSFPCEHLWVSSFSLFLTAPVAVMLIYPLSHSICHASSSRSCPILSSPLLFTERSCSLCISSWQNCCFFLLTLAMLIRLPDILIMSWSSRILYNDQVGRLCITLINKWRHATFKKEKKKKKLALCLLSCTGSFDVTLTTL